MSDTQAPFHHPGSVDFFKEMYRAWECDTVVHIGDEIDYKFLKFGTIDDPETALEQHVRALKFMKELYEAFPKVKVCKSNHGQRLENKARESGIPNFFLKQIHEYLNAPKTWEWADKWEIDNVIYEHGHRFGGLNAAQKAVKANFKSTVIGHFASQLGVHHIPTPQGMLFGMCVGCMVDDAAYGMSYAKRYSTPPALGCGIVIDGVLAFAEPYVVS